MKRPNVFIGLCAAALLVAACSERANEAPEPATMDGWVMPPRVETVSADGADLVASGRADRLGRVVIRAEGGAAHAVGADEEGRFVLRLPRPSKDTLFVVEAQAGQMAYPAPFRLFVAGDPAGPIAMLSAGAATQRLDPAPGLDAVDDDGRGRLLTGRAAAGTSVAVAAGGQAQATAGQDGRWVLQAPPSGSVVVGGQAFQPVIGEGDPGVLTRAGAGWSLSWSGPDGAGQRTWFPERPSTVR